MGIFLGRQYIILCWYTVGTCGCHGRYTSIHDHFTFISKIDSESVRVLKSGERERAVRGKEVAQHFLQYPFSWAVRGKVVCLKSGDRVGQHFESPESLPLVLQLRIRGQAIFLLDRFEFGESTAGNSSASMSSRCRVTYI